jgi:protein Tex
MTPNLRHLEERLRYLRELDERRISILASIEEQGKLTPELARDIKLADTKTRLEDLYLPYKQKRRTKGQIALEAGLGELADGLFNDPNLSPETRSRTFRRRRKRRGRRQGCPRRRQVHPHGALRRRRQPAGQTAQLL